MKKKILKIIYDMSPKKKTKYSNMNNKCLVCKNLCNELQNAMYKRNINSNNYVYSILYNSENTKNNNKHKTH